MPSPRLADSTADRVVETLRLAREVGGSELGRTLRTLRILSGFLRDELRVRKELGAWAPRRGPAATPGPPRLTVSEQVRLARP